jgi:hypothetical protein
MPNRPDSLDTLATATSLKREDILAIWADVKANQARLDRCSRHDFAPMDSDPAKRGHLGMKYRCKNCQGTIDGIAHGWYQEGLEHGRADRRE